MRILEERQKQRGRDHGENRNEVDDERSREEGKVSLMANLTMLINMVTWPASTKQDVLSDQSKSQQEHPLPPSRLRGNAQDEDDQEEPEAKRSSVESSSKRTKRGFGDADWSDPVPVTPKMFDISTLKEKL